MPFLRTDDPMTLHNGKKMCNWNFQGKVTFYAGSAIIRVAPRHTRINLKKAFLFKAILPNRDFETQIHFYQFSLHELDLSLIYVSGQTIQF